MSVHTIMNEKIPIDNKEAISEEVNPLKAELVRRNMFCLHGINGADLGLNNAVPSSLSLKERFRIVIGSRPEIPMKTVDITS